MKLSRMIEDLQNLLEHEGDLDVIIPGDHQEYYKADDVGITYAMDGDCGLELIHSDDVEYYKDEAVKYVSIY